MKVSSAAMDGTSVNSAPTTTLNASPQAAATTETFGVTAENAPSLLAEAAAVKGSAPTAPAPDMSPPSTIPVGSNSSSVVSLATDPTLLSPAKSYTEQTPPAADEPSSTVGQNGDTVVADTTSATAAETAKQTDTADKKTHLDGESRLAANQLSSILGGRARNKDELETENRQLRAELTNMRRRLTNAQDGLQLARKTVKSHMEVLSDEFRASWSETEAHIASQTDKIEKELAAASASEATASVARSKKSRPPRRSPVPVVWKGGRPGERSAPSGGLRQVPQMHQPQLHVLHPQMHQQVAGANALHAIGVPGIQMPGQPGQVSKKRSRRKNPGSVQHFPPNGSHIFPEPSQNVGTGNRRLIAQIEQTESIRNEMRTASTQEDLRNAIAKARLFNMKDEVKVANKKLNLLGNTVGSPLAAATVPPTTSP